MTLTARGISLKTDENGLIEISIAVHPDSGKDARKFVQEVKKWLSEGKDKFSVSLDRFRKKRTICANDYCWMLCQKIAEAISSTKEQVYKRFIRDVGQFEIVPIRADAVERWIKNWDKTGLGWFAEVVDGSKLNGYKRVITYFGSSVYDSREMAVLIDEIIQECHGLGIETKTPNEIARLKSEWGE